ncbi:hypothetical protein C9885_29945, partial [Klebsiella pneumoniae]
RRGGRNGNLKAIDACITRLRLTVGDSAKVNDAASYIAAVGGTAT